MARHFLGLYLLIVLTLAAVSWGQDRLLQAYGVQDADESLSVALYALESRLGALPPQDRRSALAEIAAKTGRHIELIPAADIAGRRTLEELAGGKIAYMQGASGESWALKQLADGEVLAYQSVEPQTWRTPLEWAITVAFYAAIALVIMIWIWPLRRDLRALEGAAARYGNRNWTFGAEIKPRSQIFALADTFRKMAARIDGLIASHKDMSNAVSHEIKTPLARMQFEIELAQASNDLAQVKSSLGNIKADVAAINELVSATLNYAILERADMSLNLGTHDFTVLLPALAEHVLHEARPDIRLEAEVLGDAHHVICDLHLIETVIKNLLYNAARYARRKVRVTFEASDGANRLRVEDDGPGIPEPDRERVFGSFVQLDPVGAKKTGFGLGLAIVKRAIEWHGGRVGISQSPLGGAQIWATWPVAPAAR
ncbi:MAG TPA: ATP-binding protein [Steroidobacteraceae bacterium]|nr:ATP-binding protein [Steroidobacteraceae bacterium]